MHPNKFGDSYDIVKGSLLQWLSECGTWAAHPMFSVPPPPGFAELFASFLGVRLVTTNPVPARPNKEGYFEEAKAWSGTDHLFLDPDTGIALPAQRSVGRGHLMAAELAAIAQGRPRKLTLVFDQSFPRSSNEARLRQTKDKLRWLDKHGVHGLVYCSHANFVLVSSDHDALSSAKRTLVHASRLPLSRFVEL